MGWDQLSGGVSVSQIYTVYMCMYANQCRGSNLMIFINTHWNVQMYAVRKNKPSVEFLDDALSTNSMHIIVR